MKMRHRRSRHPCMAFSRVDRMLLRTLRCIEAYGADRPTHILVSRAGVQAASRMPLAPQHEHIRGAMNPWRDEK